MQVGYVRVSTKEQLLDRQIDALVASGVDERNIYKEKATGTKLDRAELNRLIDGLKEGDLVVVPDLTRLSRSTKDLFAVVDKIHAKGADIKSLKESWVDTTTPQGKFMFTMFAGISQFERDLISERTKEGLQAAKTRGRKGGRPSKQNEKADTVLLLQKEGKTRKEIASQVEISESTVGRIVRENRQNN